jgi:hypothetical protein
MMGIFRRIARGPVSVLEVGRGRSCRRAGLVHARSGEPLCWVESEGREETRRINGVCDRQSVRSDGKRKKEGDGA